VPNVASEVCRTASKALSNLFAPYLLEFSSDGGVEASIRRNRTTRSGVYMFNGHVTHEGIAEELNMKYKSLDLLVAAI
jgi:alanine dehydrogenase